MSNEEPHPVVETVASSKRTTDQDHSNSKRPKKEHKITVDENGVPLPRSERRPKKKVACMIGYCGTGYNGMQLQPKPEVKTIEGELFAAFARAGAVSPENADDLKKNGFMRCARTDKGVHAAGNVVSLKMIIEDADIVDRINAELPEQIRVWGIQRTSKAFDCRKMCSSRVYEYLLPTYTLLPPKPKTVLSNLVAEKSRDHPGVVRDDKEGKQWWADTRRAVVETSGLTIEEIERVETVLEDPNTTNSSIKTYDENGEITEMGRIMRAYKNVENLRRRSYAVSKERLELLRSAMRMYEGTNNFHNFTLGKTFKDPSAMRFMKSTTVLDPFVIEGTEWVSIHIHGQSFMLHQIRKMIAMATLVVRTGCPLERIRDCFGPTKINIPKAPALGLLLENPVFEAYNGMLEKLDYEHIDFGKYADKIDAFKKKFIYDKIYAEEVRENSFYGFFGFLDSLNTSQADEEAKKSGHKHIFDFLGAVFDSGLDETGRVKEKNEKKEEKKEVEEEEKKDEKKDEKIPQFDNCD